MVGSSLLIQKTYIPMEIDSAPLWANLFLDTYGNEYMSKLISEARYFYAIKRFIDDLGILNDGGVFNDVYKDIAPPKLQLKVKYSGTHATFLNLDTTVKDGVFVYKLFDKRYPFSFFIVRMPYIDDNIPRLIFYTAQVGEFHRITRSSLLYTDFNEKAMQLFNE